MKPKGTRSLFYPDPSDATKFIQVILKSQRISVQDVTANYGSAYCFLQNTNLCKINSQGRGQAAMIKLDNVWRLCFVWRLTLDKPLQFHQWNGPCGGDGFPDVLTTKECPISSFKFCEMTVTPENKFLWVNAISSQTTRDEKFCGLTSKPFDCVDTEDGKIQSSIWGPCAIRLPNPFTTVQGSGKKKRKRRGRRGRNKHSEKWKERHDCNKSYCIAYVVAGDCTTPAGESNTALVPFKQDSTSSLQEFGVVKNEDIKEMEATFHGCSFNNYLSEICIRRVTLRVLDPAQAPLRIMQVSQAAFDVLKSRKDLELLVNGNCQMLKGSSCSQPTDLEGIMVSCWMQDQLIRDHSQIGYKFSQEIHEVVGGDHYGDRGCSKCLGVNHYNGIRESSRPLISPTCGRKYIKGSCYYRQTWKCPDKQAALEKKIGGLAGAVKQLAKEMNPNIFPFIGEDLCTRVIWTQGNATSTTGARKADPLPVLAFSNDCHIDPDNLDDDMTSRWMEEVTNTSQATKNEYTRRVCTKLEEMQDTIGLGLPTTCGYRFCWQNQGPESRDGSIHQYFAYNSFGICVRVRNYSAHHFYGWAFPHQTSFCIRLLDNAVVVKNAVLSSDDFILSAWGDNGGPKDARANESTRRRNDRAARRNARR